MAASRLPARERVLARLRNICLALPGTVERPSFGNPAFRVGAKPYVVLDRYKGADCLFFYVDPARRDALLREPNFFKAPYDPREKALCRTLDKIDWRELKGLIVDSHRLATAKRARRSASGARKSGSRFSATSPRPTQKKGKPPIPT